MSRWIPRIQLFELQELWFCPGVIRRCIQDAVLTLWCRAKESVETPDSVFRSQDVSAAVVFLESGHHLGLLSSRFRRAAACVGDAGERRALSCSSQPLVCCRSRAKRRSSICAAARADRFRTCNSCLVAVTRHGLVLTLDCAARKYNRNVAVKLTDLYPNSELYARLAAENKKRHRRSGINPDLDFSSEPVNALSVSPQLRGFRTLFARCARVVVPSSNLFCVSQFPSFQA